MNSKGYIELDYRIRDAAEAAAEQVLNLVHPTLDSEEKRRDVVDYVQRLVKSRVNCEVVSYGSVPLKTYLPDGDIDLTVIKGPTAEDSVVHGVLSLLQDEEQNQNAEYEVTDTQFIDAEVKLVKCLVRNIVIDISFNQLGGLSTLCFLEQVDRFIGRNHLFKRSIILVKTWCYYESRILGAHHGLLSTYALETLILYIFQFFHSSLSGPLEVLHRFLDYYSQFDWENYCISLEGPVCKSSLPGIVVKMPESSWRKLLSEEFLENCMEMFSVPSRGLESHPKVFQIKHLNIIDPLKENNNLGRSVHIGNSYRIRSALKYGARRLGQILLQPKEKVADEISNFFANTCARHENEHRCSARHLILEMDDEESWTASLSSPVEPFSEDILPLKSFVSDFEDSVGVVKQIPILLNNEPGLYSSEGVSSECHHSVDGDEDAPETTNSILRNGSSDYISSNDNYNASVFENHCHKSHSFDQFENGSYEAEANQFDSSRALLNSWFGNRDKCTKMSNTYKWCMDSSELFCSNGSVDFRELDTNCRGSSDSDLFNSLADLTGDYDSHVRSFLQGQLCHGYSLSPRVVCSSPSAAHSRTIVNKNTVVAESMPVKTNKLSPTNMNRVSAEPIVHAAPVPPLLVPAFNFAPMQKARGMGTYFPQTNILYSEKSTSPGGSRTYILENHGHRQDTGHSNGGFESQPASNGHCRPGPWKLNHSHSMERQNETNGYSNPICRIEFGSIRNLEELVSGASIKTPKSTTATIPPMVSGQSVCLKNEADFPPLRQQKRTF